MTSSASTGPASTLYHGGSVHNEADPSATAMLVRGDEIAWIGSEDAADAHLDGADTVVQLGGALVTAAFVDAHVHASMTGQGLDGVDLSSTQSLTEALRLIETAGRHGRGRPVYAHSWDETRWPEGRPATSAELDRATYGGVVYMLRIDAHSACVSSALAAAAQVHGRDGWDGVGVVHRDAHHAVRDTFHASVTGVDRRHYIDLAMRAAAEAGIGLVHEMAAPHIGTPEDLADVAAAGRRGDGPLVVAYWGELVGDERSARELVDRYQVRGLAGDLCADGSLGSRTAHVRAPYRDGPEPGDRGYGYLSADQVRDHVSACSLAGIQAGFHVIGDAAIDTVLAGLRAAADVVGTDRVRAARHRLEHVEMLDDAGIAELARLGVHASVQPAFDAAWGGTEDMYAARLGADRALATNPYASMAAAGVPLALGSDTPVTPFAPWEAIRASAHHHEPSQRISVRSAFLAHTRGGWRAAGIDDRGDLRPGQPASFAIWAVDGPPGADGLPELSPGAPAPIALRTVIQGRTVFEREGAFA